MAEKNIELDSVEVAAAVFGNCDRNIRLLENEFSVTAVCRGTQLRLSGEPANVAAASRAVEGMLLLIENHTPLEDQTVRYCISLAHDGAEKRVKELTEDFVTVTVKGRPIRPKTLGQKEYLNAIRTNAITFHLRQADHTLQHIFSVSSQRIRYDKEQTQNHHIAINQPHLTFFIYSVSMNVSPCRVHFKLSA